MTIDIRIETTYNTNYMGEWDLPEDGSDLRLTIKDVTKETIHNPTTHTETEEIVLTWEEPKYKPYILSARVNKDNIKQALGTGRTKDWVGKKVQLYREAGNWFGKAGFAIRFRPFVSQ